MTLKITSISVDPNDEYVSCDAFQKDYASVAIEPPERELPAVLVGRDQENGTATFCATHGVWPEGPDENGLSVYVIEFSGVTRENIKDAYDLAIFASMTHENGYDRATSSEKIVLAYEEAIFEFRHSAQDSMEFNT